jgi:hypothetical protein
MMTEIGRSCQNFGKFYAKARFCFLAFMEKLLFDENSIKAF